MTRRMIAVAEVRNYIDKRLSELEREYRDSLDTITQAHNMGQQKALLDLRLRIEGVES